MLSPRVEFVELGADYNSRRSSPEAETRRLMRRLENLGHHVRLDPAA